MNILTREKRIVDAPASPPIFSGLKNQLRHQKAYDNDERSAE